MTLYTRSEKQNEVHRAIADMSGRFAAALENVFGTCPEVALVFPLFVKRSFEFGWTVLGRQLAHAGRLAAVTSAVKAW